MREFTEVEKAYLEELAIYYKVLKVTALISINQQGIQTNDRGVRAVKIFTRQTVLAFSLQKLLPKPDYTKLNETKLWDVPSIATLTRNLLEGYLSLYYFGIENITEDEANLRFLILQLHKNVEWYDFRKRLNPFDPELKGFEQCIPEQKDIIANHNFYSKLTSNQQGRIKKGSEIYKSKADFEKEVPICKDLGRDFRMLSNLAHPVPWSIERIDDECGRGVGSQPDVTYCMFCIMIARRYLAASTIGIADFFPIELAGRFSKKIDSIRLFENLQ